VNPELRALVLDAVQYPDPAVGLGMLLMMARSRGIALSQNDAWAHLQNARSAHWEENPPSTNGTPENLVPKLAPALSIAELLEMEEPKREYLIEPIMPVGNVLIAAYPKSGKTFFALAAAIALASGESFLGRFTVPHRRKVGLVMLEDQPHRIRRRMRRICEGIGIELAELDGFIQVWFRPPGFQFHDAQIMSDLHRYTEENELDLLLLDHFSLAADGDFDSASEVAPQLESFRRSSEPGSPGLIAHAKKLQDKQSDDLRLTDLIRNSSAFGAWYDAGIVLARQNENAPIQVRIELRDDRSPDPFMIELTDEIPGYTDERGSYHRAQGWLKMEATSTTPQAARQQQEENNLARVIQDFLSTHPGSSQNQIRRSLGRRMSDIQDAILLGQSKNMIRQATVLAPGPNGVTEGWVVSNLFLVP